MLNRFKQVVKKFIPTPLLKTLRPWYHGSIALIANVMMGRPSGKLIVIGVTGTAGKSTTTAMLAHILNSDNKKTGYITTVNFFDGNKDYINKHGMSMPGPWLLQKQLAMMVKNNCQYAIIECTSEGLAQNRHLGIKFDAALFTNLSAAHQDSHGSFQNYKQAKLKLFAALAKTGKKIVGVNLDDSNAKDFLNFLGEKFGTTTNPTLSMPNVKTYLATDTKTEPSIAFRLKDVNFQLSLVGKFNLYNALLAVGTADMLGVKLDDSAKALNSFKEPGGRMEQIPNTRSIKIFVDYAPEPVGMQAILSTLNELPHNKLIHVFGSTGGFRDNAKRFEFGGISAKLADTIIITNDDVYDSDPKEIAQNIEQGINQVAGQAKKVSEVITILDRREAISKALTITEPNDIVIITGKGSEQFLVLPGDKRISWDDRTVVKEELAKLK